VHTDRRRWVDRRDIVRDHRGEDSEEEGVDEVDGEVAMDTDPGHSLGRGVGRRAEVLRDRRTVVHCPGRRRRDADMEDAIARRVEVGVDEAVVAVEEVEAEGARAIVLMAAEVHETGAGAEIEDDQREQGGLVNLARYQFEFRCMFDHFSALSLVSIRISDLTCAKLPTPQAIFN